MPDLFRQIIPESYCGSLKDVICLSLVESEAIMAQKYSVPERSVRLFLYDVISESSFGDFVITRSKKEGFSMPLEEKIKTALEDRLGWVCRIQEVGISLEYSNYDNSQDATICIFCLIKFLEKGNMVSKRIQIIDIKA